VGTWEEGKQFWLEVNGASMKYKWYLDEGQVLLGRKRIGSYPTGV
jgi:SOS-response transcriptional repressor LexA